MKFKILSLPLTVVVIAAVFIMPGMLWAGGNTVDEKTQAVPVEKSVVGTLTAMESYGHILIRPDSGNLTRLRMRPDTVVTRNGKPAKFSDLHAGDKVQASYDSRNWVSELHATGS